jgi:hypothetical protein
MEGLTNCVPSTVFRVAPNGVSTNFVRDRDEVLEGAGSNPKYCGWRTVCEKLWGHL